MPRHHPVIFDLADLSVVRLLLAFFFTKGGLCANSRDSHRTGDRRPGLGH
jgi:hypothetical protein